MSTAGWYPDPAGTPNTYRFWTGQSWSEQTTTNPADPVPGAVPPPPPTGPPPAQPPTQPPTQPPAYPPAPQAPYQPYGQAPQPYAQPAPGSGGTSSGGRTALFAVLAVVLVLALGVGAFFGVRALRGDDSADDPDGPATSDTSEPTEGSDGSDTTEPTDPDTDTDAAPTEPTSTQCTGGTPSPTTNPKVNATRISGGGLSMPTLLDDGYSVQVSYALAFTFADEFTPIERVIESYPRKQTGWVSTMGVGALDRENGFESPQQAAEVVMECMTTNPALYDNFERRVDLDAGPVTIDGAEGYSVQAELYVDNPDIRSVGDVAQVIVVDTGDPATLGLYVSVVPIGDDDLIGLQATVPDQIRVD